MAPLRIANKTKYSISSLRCQLILDGWFDNRRTPNLTNNKTYAFTAGALACVIMDDGYRAAQPDGLAGMCPDVPPSEVQAAAEAVLQNGGRLEYGFNCLYIKAGDRHLLLDVGLRSDGDESFGHLLDTFKTAEITPETIDTLIFSHAHNDHIDGALDGDGNLNFPDPALVPVDMNRHMPMLGFYGLPVKGTN